MSLLSPLCSPLCLHNEDSVKMKDSSHQLSAGGISSSPSSVAASSDQPELLRISNLVSMFTLLLVTDLVFFPEAHPPNIFAFFTFIVNNQRHLSLPPELPHKRERVTHMLQTTVDVLRSCPWNLSVPLPSPITHSDSRWPHCCSENNFLENWSVPFQLSRCCAALTTPRDSSPVHTDFLFRHHDSHHVSRSCP